MRVLLAAPLAHESSRIHVEEQYRDEAAWELHQSSSYGKTYFPKMRAIIDITVEYFDVVVP